MTIEDEARAAAEKRYANLHAPVRINAYVEGYTAGANRPTGETFDEDTLRKVFDALESVTGSEVAADDCLHAMQNAGILFREHASELSTSPGSAKNRPDSLHVSLSGVPETESDSHLLSNFESSEATCRDSRQVRTDEREALAQVVYYWDTSEDVGGKAWDELTEGMRDTWREAADAILTSDVWRNRHPRKLPHFLTMPDGAAYPCSCPLLVNHGPLALTPEQYIDAARHPQPTEGEPSDAALDAAYIAFQAHSRSVEFNEFGEHVCSECGYAFSWPEGEPVRYVTPYRRLQRHIARAALRAALALDFG